MSKFAPVPSRLEYIPFFKAFVGIVLILLWIGVSAFSILTTEDLFKGGNGSGVRPDWTVLTQLWGVVQGQYYGIDVVAILGAWAIFILYLVMSVAEAITPDNRGEDKVFKTICYLIILLDGYATWHYLRILPPEYQWLMTIIISMVIIFCGKKGINLILEATNEFGEG